MIKLFALLLLTSTVLSLDHKLIKKYALSKLMETCLGEEATKDWQHQVSSAVDSCYYSTDYDANPRYGEESGEEIQVSWQDILQKLKGNEREYRIFSPYERKYRNKRASHEKKYYNAKKIRSLKNKMVSKISNFTCILQKLEIIDDNMELRVDDMISTYRSLDLHYALKNDLVNTIKLCEKFVKCIPTENSPFPEEVKQAYKFLKCERKHRVVACLKHDLRKVRDEFEFEGLDEELSHLNDDDKMLAVIIGDEEVGHDDFHLYE